MDNNQINALNNAMSMLLELKEDVINCVTVDGFKGYINSYIESLEKSKVDKRIITHFKNLVESTIPVAEEWSKIHADRQKALEDAYEWESSLRKYEVEGF